MDPNDTLDAMHNYYAAPMVAQVSTVGSAEVCTKRGYARGSRASMLVNVYESMNSLLHASPQCRVTPITPRCQGTGGHGHCRIPLPAGHDIDECALHTLSIYERFATILRAKWNECGPPTHRGAVRGRQPRELAEQDVRGLRRHCIAVWSGREQLVHLRTGDADVMSMTASRPEEMKGWESQSARLAAAVGR